MKNKTDIELYHDFLKGNNEAFDEITQRYRKNLLIFIFKYVADVEIAEDLAQDTFVYVLMNKKEYDFKYSMKTYLYTIAKCRAINYIQKHKKYVGFDESYIANQEDNQQIDDNLIKQENKKELQNAIKKIKPEYQRVLILKDIEEFKYREICKILDKTMPQVKVLIYRARKSLEKNLRKENLGC